MSEPVAVPIVLLATASNSEEAERLSRALVERRLAACVNVVPGVRSFYRWQGEVQSDAELLLVIKTIESREDELRRTFRELHSYDLPELIRLEVSGGDPDYLDWLAAASAAEGEPRA